MVHSMGSRLFLNSLRYADADNLFVTKSKGFSEPRFVPPPEQLNLVNLVFIHPEHYLDDFVTGGGYEACKQIADFITVYCHANDEALMSAEILSKGRKCMGRHPFGYIRSLPKQRSYSSPSNRISTTASPEGDALSSNEKKTPCKSPPSSSSEADAEVLSPVDRFGIRTKGTARWRPPNGMEPLNLGSLSIIDPPLRQEEDNAEYEWLDLDVIDCTYLEANVHQLRHCFFNINASVVGDLRELLTQKTRASQRHHQLERRDGNVYTFRVPPAKLSSIFGV
eukprot:Protomagalhaensia_sp_Gyna_25__2627@NODE_2498_length_1051_cov_9_311265_g2070_i0_p1_GENE_NODE_2498_length_1051_cov_9_311265_g2070_i0NODE_2498_length_1051_cov_9_311265_g2070_i0_p1_ORF_typecomplete_len280_score24_57DUF900/PF05990_12/7_5e10_NODE_2498_length_1051_cov_9_311265_g2070_i01721011